MKALMRIRGGRVGRPEPQRSRDLGPRTEQWLHGSGIGNDVTS